MTCIVRATRRLFGATGSASSHRRDDRVATLSAIVHAHRAEAERTARVAEAAWRARNDHHGAMAAYLVAREAAKRAADTLTAALNNHFDASEDARIRRLHEIGEI